MVSTPLKNTSQNGNLPQVGVKIKKNWNHHPDTNWITLAERHYFRDLFLGDPIPGGKQKNVPPASSPLKKKRPFGKGGRSLPFSTHFPTSNFALFKLRFGGVFITKLHEPPKQTTCTQRLGRWIFHRPSLKAEWASAASQHPRQHIGRVDFCFETTPKKMTPIFSNGKKKHHLLACKVSGSSIFCWKKYSGLLPFRPSDVSFLTNPCELQDAAGGSGMNNKFLQGSLNYQPNHCTSKGGISLKNHPYICCFFDPKKNRPI